MAWNSRNTAGIPRNTAGTRGIPREVRNTAGIRILFWPIFLLFLALAVPFVLVKFFCAVRSHGVFCARAARRGHAARGACKAAAVAAAGAGTPPGRQTCIRQLKGAAAGARRARADRRQRAVGLRFAFGSDAESDGPRKPQQRAHSPRTQSAAPPHRRLGAVQGGCFL